MRADRLYMCKNCGQRLRVSSHLPGWGCPGDARKSHDWGHYKKTAGGKFFEIPTPEEWLIPDDTMADYKRRFNVAY